METKYQQKTIERWLAYLEELGLSVYGQCMDVESGEEFPACMDYDASDIVKRRRHVEQDTLWRREF